MPGVVTPLEVAEVTGTKQRNPQRFKNRTKPKHLDALGSAPSRFSEDEAKAFEQTRTEMYWLRESDRLLVEELSRLRAQCWADPKPALTRIDRILKICRELGASPTSRHNITLPPDEDKNPEDEFLN